MKDYQNPLLKNSYKKPCLVIENFAPNTSISSCRCTVTLYSLVSPVYYDVNGDGVYSGNEIYNNVGTSKTVTIDIQENKDLGYVFKATADMASQGIQKGDLRMRSLSNSSYNFYSAYNNLNHKYNNNGISGVKGIDGKMYITNKLGFTSITDKTFS